MSCYAIYLQDSGDVVRVIETPSNLVAANLHEGELALECDAALSIDWEAFRIDVMTAEIVEKQRPIASVANALLADVERERRLRAELPIAIPAGLFNADSIARDNIRNWLLVIQSGGTLPPGFEWRDFQNAAQPCSAQMLGQIWSAIAYRGTALYQAAWNHKEAIRMALAAGDRETLDGYDALSGWPT